jgi:HTH-type transcriptional regulator / antitoxin HigA
MANKPIQSEEEYRTLLKEFGALWDGDPTPGTPTGDRFEELAVLLDQYERKHFPIVED